MKTKTVADLVDETRRGSAEARDELVRRYHRETAILAAAMVNDATEAEDLAQEAFIRAFRNLDLLVDPGRFGAWPRRIVMAYRSTGSEASGRICIVGGVMPTSWQAPLATAHRTPNWTSTNSWRSRP